MNWHLFFFSLTVTCLSVYTGLYISQLYVSSHIPHIYAGVISQHLKLLVIDRNQFSIFFFFPVYNNQLKPSSTKYWYIFPTLDLLLFYIFYLSLCLCVCVCMYTSVGIGRQHVGISSLLPCRLQGWNSGLPRWQMAGAFTHWAISMASIYYFLNKIRFNAQCSSSLPSPLPSPSPDYSQRLSR